MRSADGSRNQVSRQILEQRRSELQADLRHDIHDARGGVDAVQAEDSTDDLDTGSVMAQSSLRFSLMHMKGEILVRIDEALARIDQGLYGLCQSCGAEIAESRLRALPFALRCTRCETRREDAEEAQHAPRVLQRLRSEW
jgi:DnaK suppressor protein